jgi:hypothetical protein
MTTYAERSHGFIVNRWSFAVELASIPVSTISSGCRLARPMLRMRPAGWRALPVERSIRRIQIARRTWTMKRMNALAIALATVLTATAAHAERSTLDDVQAPRGQDIQAPRDRTDDVEAPRGQQVQ